MWSEEKVREWARRCIDRFYFDTPGTIASKSFYTSITEPAGFGEESGWRFDKMRAEVEREVQRYKQRMSQE